MELTKGKIIEMLERVSDLRIDTALPQGFFDFAADCLRDCGAADTHPLSHFVGWAYDGRGAFGFPLPMTILGWEVVAMAETRTKKNTTGV